MKEIFINTYENVYPLNRSRRLSSKVGIILSEKIKKTEFDTVKIPQQKMELTQGYMTYGSGQNISNGGSSLRRG